MLKYLEQVLGLRHHSVTCMPPGLALPAETGDVTTFNPAN